MEECRQGGTEAATLRKKKNLKKILLNGQKAKVSGSGEVEL